MNILLISRCPPYPLHLGDRLIIYHLARELSKRGHVIDLLAFSDRLEDLHEREHYAAYFRHIHLIPEPIRTQRDYVKRLLLPDARFPKQADQAWSPQMWDLIRQLISENSYDLAHLFGSVQVYEYAHALDGLPALITPYESYSLYLRRVQESSRQFPANMINRARLQITRAFERFMFTPYKHTVVVSDRDQVELSRLNAQLPITVIPNGIDLETFQLEDQPREAATLLFTGNYEYAPNVDAALHLAHDIFPQVRERIPDAQLWLVGNAPPKELQALKASHITVTGHVPDIRPYLAAATVFVSPLRLGAGIKNKVLEALAMGCPVIATPLSVDGIAIEHGENIYLAQADHLPDAIYNLLKDTDLQQRLSHNGRALIEARYTWALVAQHYERLYSDTIKLP